MQLRDIQACLRAAIEQRAQPVGPFLVLINSESDNPFLNYAVPVDGAAPTAADVTALVEFFRSRDRMPRLEYVRPAPDVDQPLVAAGFDVAATLTLMAVDRLVPPAEVPGYRVRLVDDEAGLKEVLLVQNVAYGEPDLTADRIGIRRTVRDGGCVALATEEATGAPAGAGLWPPQRFGLVEVLGIGVLPDHRRRGIAASVASALTEEALRRGHQPFLQVEKDEPFRIYERIGYQVIGDMADARLVAG